MSFAAGGAASAAAPAAVLGIGGGAAKRVPQSSRPGRGVKFSRIFSVSGNMKD